MPRTRIPLNISFLSVEEKEKAISKAKQRKTTVSKLVRAYFKRLPNLPDLTKKEKATLQRDAEWEMNIGICRAKQNLRRLAD